VIPKLLIVTSHPIQYQVPWFRALHKDSRIQLEVLFLTLPSAHEQGIGFDTSFEWDIPLLDGYHWRLADSVTGGIGKGYFGLRVKHARSEVMSSKPDAILVTGWQHCGMLQCLRAAVGSGKPVLVRAESNGLKPLGYWQKLKARLGLAGVDLFLPIGKANKLFYRKIGLKRRIGQQVPYFVDNQYFNNGIHALRGKQHYLRQQFGIPEEAVCFVFSGKLLEKKRPLQALEALREMVSGLPKNAVHLLVVGSGALEATLQRYASQHALPVSFTGFLNQSEMPSAYAASDCLLLPSDYGETWGLVVNEAMACGLPAIVSDRVGCGPDLVHEGQTGFSFPFGNVRELARVMQGFLSLSLGERKLLGENARRMVVENYSIELAANNTIEAVLTMGA